MAFSKNHSLEGNAGFMKGRKQKPASPRRVITCPKHHASFDLITGKSLIVNVHKITLYQVRIEGMDLLFDI